MGVNRPDWVQWHNLYETPERVVAQRLVIVQRLIRDFLASRARDQAGLGTHRWPRETLALELGQRLFTFFR